MPKVIFTFVLYLVVINVSAQMDTILISFTHFGEKISPTDRKHCLVIKYQDHHGNFLKFKSEGRDSLFFIPRGIQDLDKVSIQFRCAQYKMRFDSVYVAFDDKVKWSFGFDSVLTSEMIDYPGFEEALMASKYYYYLRIDPLVHGRGRTIIQFYTKRKHRYFKFIK